jgi:hypothetical protein
LVIGLLMWFEVPTTMYMNKHFHVLLPSCYFQLHSILTYAYM